MVNILWNWGNWMKILKNQPDTKNKKLVLEAACSSKQGYNISVILVFNIYLLSYIYMFFNM